MNTARLWQTKLAARLHDPAEKALVLLRDPEGHENGTSRALRRLMGLEQLGSQIDPDNDEVLAKILFPQSLASDIYRQIQRADWWAAAADRPQWPMEERTVTTKSGAQRTFPVANWAQVLWTKAPILIHPLTGEEIDLHGLHDTDVSDIKERAFRHFAALAKAIGERKDGDAWRATFLAFWRFGPELSEDADNGKMGALWPLLPADTRVPDHSIWEHLDLTSAFAGAFAADPQGDAALLALSIGPVQSFIASARKLDDLWAGSHLLSRLAWETMRPVAEALGPDAFLFPRLRGIALVDLWLRDAMGLPAQLFEQCEWQRGASDSNPLFAAALPNRFVALVPASRARELAEACRESARQWIQDRGQETVRRLLTTAGLEDDPFCPAYAQMREQLSSFPEVYWAAVPFSLIRCRDHTKQRDLDLTNLQSAMAPFFGEDSGRPCGFLNTAAWKVLSQAIDVTSNGQQVRFFHPNPGVLYPAVYDLAERVLAAAKTARPFDQKPQTGWRESLCGDVEWLTTDRTHLALPPGQRTDTLWTRIAHKRPAWARQGEHLGGLAALKRLWPTLFAQEVEQALGNKNIFRYSVSTHAMALARQLDVWLENDANTSAAAIPEIKVDPVVLPRGLVLRHSKRHPEALQKARILPALLDAASEMEDESQAEKIRHHVRDILAQGPPAPALKKRVRLESYYGLLMMDGDHMGAILSGDETTGTAITYRESFHEQVRRGFDRLAQSCPAVRDYGNQRRAVSPGRHLAISAALNDFSQHVARHVVEEEHLGRLIYAGGDDVLAVLPVADLMSCASRLRQAYSGITSENAPLDWHTVRQHPQQLHCKNGFAFLRGRLMRMMGKNATASAGLVVAHHQAPLSAVLRELRAAEKRAKEEGGRNAFAITVIKRAGGALHFTAPWGEPMALLLDTIRFLAAPTTSRRAVYHSLKWLADLPDPKTHPDILETLLGYQLARQSKGEPAKHAPLLAQRLTQIAQQQAHPKEWLENFLAIAEFLARETRMPADTSLHTGKEYAA